MPLRLRRRPEVKASTRRRWLLVYNCQVMGLANCLNLSCDEIEVEHYDPAGFRAQSAALLKRMGEFERILVAPQLETEVAAHVKACPAAWIVPTITFDAYHPDLCYLMEAGKALKGPMGDYHSLIAYAAFRSGCTPQEARSLYREAVYAELGYLDRWDRARVMLLDTFRQRDFPLDARQVGWSRNEPFMYSVNHPRIHCVRDVARCILERAGLEAAYADALPHDNLANGPIFPVYPEIASALSVSGSYLFKRGGQYSFLRLPEFVDASFDLYRNRAISIHPKYEQSLGLAMQVVEASR